jgi:hypothetical protein
VSRRYSTPIRTAPASNQAVWASTGGIGITLYRVTCGKARESSPERRGRSSKRSEVGLSENAARRHF